MSAGASTGELNGGIEKIETIVEITDAELIEDKEYAAMGKTLADRVKTLLGKHKSLGRSKERRYNVSAELRQTSRKFAGRVEKNLRKPA